MRFWSLLAVAWMPVLQVLLAGLLGACLASSRFNVLTSDARRHINKVALFLNLNLTPTHSHTVTKKIFFVVLHFAGCLCCVRPIARLLKLGRHRHAQGHRFLVRTGHLRAYLHRLVNSSMMFDLLNLMS